MFEESPYDDNGQPLASTLIDHLLPGPTELPRFRIVHMETPSPYSAHGLKGVGEGGAIAPSAALVNAINDYHNPPNSSVAGAHPGLPGSGTTKVGQRSMKPAQFDYVRPRGLQEAVDSLSEADANAKVMAGGQSLVPMLNALGSTRQVGRHPPSVRTTSSAS